MRGSSGLWAVVLLVTVILGASGAWAQGRPQARQPRVAVPSLVPPPPAPPPPRLAATVNGQDITEESATRFAWTRMGRTILETIIDDVLIRQAANRAGYTATSEEVTKRLAALAAEAGNTQKLIAKRGVAGLEALRSQIATEILLEKLVDGAAKVTEEQCRDYYKAHLDDYTAPTKVHLFEIVTDDAETAYQSRKRIAEGEAFGNVARQVSSAASRENGGDLGWLTLDEIGEDALRPVVATLKVGEVSSPVLCKGKFHILMVSEKTSGEVKSYEQVRDEIAAKLRAAKGVSPESVLMSLRRGAHIRIAAEPYKYLEDEYARLGQIKVVVDGKPVELSKAPVILPSGRIIGPVKEVFRSAGCRVQWVANTKTLVIARETKTIRLVVGSDEGQAEGKTVPLGEKVELRDGIIWAAPRPVAEALGLKIHWDAADYTLELTTPKE